MQSLPDTAWNAWTPRELAERLREAPFEWYVVGGWALDLWHGRETRAHADLEFAVLAEDVARCRALFSDLEFFTARDGTLDYLAPSTAPLKQVAQFWGADMRKGCWRVEMMLDLGTSDVWIYKRNPAIHMPRTDAIRKSPRDIPYLAPANVLLFKAKYRKEKDESDFRRALPNFLPSERATLRNWLEQAHPGHTWIQSLQ